MTASRLFELKYNKFHSTKNTKYTLLTMISGTSPTRHQMIYNTALELRVRAQYKTQASSNDITLYFMSKAIVLMLLK